MKLSSLESLESMIDQALTRRAERSAQDEQSTAQASSIRSTAQSQIAHLRNQSAVLAAEQMEFRRQEAILAQQKAELDESLLRVQNRLLQLSHDQLNVSFAVDRQEAILRTTCSPQIDQFIDSMNTEQTRLMRLAPSNRTGFSEKNLLDEIPRVRRLTYSNGPAIARRINACVAARSRAEELKTLDQTEEELRAQLEGLEAALPTIQDCFELVRE